MSRRPPQEMSPSEGGRLAPLIPAATVVLLRPGAPGLEVLLTRRPGTMAFGPDIHVFPGGRVDPADATPTSVRAAGLSEAEAAANLGVGLAPDGGMTPARALAHHVAAVRETAEETGIAIAAADLIALTRWVTPASLARRFDVRFFAVLVPPGTAVAGRSDEVAEARWATPAAALALAGSGEIELWHPTFVTLQQLLGLADAPAVRAAFALGTSPGGPRIERVRADLARVDAAWAGGIPGRCAVGWLVGEHEVVVVDPADPTGVTSEAIRAEVAANNGRLAGVVVMGPAPECHAGVEMFAHGLGLPIAAPIGMVPWAPYPFTELPPSGPLPFGDPGVTLEDVLRLA